MEKFKIARLVRFTFLLVELLLAVANKRFRLDCSDVEDLFHCREVIRGQLKLKYD